jgi:ketosteroid isomerase-like protein
MTAMDRLNLLLSRHDPKIIQEFAPDSDVLLLGSDADELAIGHEQLADFFQKIVSLPVTLSWEWKQTKVSSLGNVAWIFAQGDIVVRSASGEKRSPYRLTGVLERQNGKWLWRQFHGSEPAPAQ